MSSAELTDWMAYEELDPFGRERGDMQAALVASTGMNLWRGKKDKAVTVEDLMPDFGGLRARQEREQRRKRKQRRAERRTAREQAEALARATGARLVIEHRGEAGGGG